MTEISISTRLKVAEFYGGPAVKAGKDIYPQPERGRAQLELVKKIWRDHDLLADDRSALVPVDMTAGMMDVVLEHGWDEQAHPEFKPLHALLKRLQREGVAYLIFGLGKS